MFVKSHYRAPWTGIILGRVKRKPYKAGGRRYRPNDLVQVLILFDRHGNRMTRRVVRVLDIAWLSEIPKFDTSWVNPDWLKCYDRDWR